MRALLPSGRPQAGRVECAPGAGAGAESHPRGAGRQGPQLPALAPHLPAALPPKHPSSWPKAPAPSASRQGAHPRKAQGSALAPWPLVSSHGALQGWGPSVAAEPTLAPEGHLGGYKGTAPWARTCGDSTARGSARLSWRWWERREGSDSPPPRPPLRPPGGDWGRHGRRGRGRGSPGSGCPKPPVGSGLARERLLGWPQGLPLASAGSPLAEELQLSVGSPESPCRRRAETKDHSLAAFRVPRLPATPSHSPGTQLHPQGREQRVAFCLWVCLAVSLHLSLSLSFSRSLPRLPRLSVQVRRSRGIEAGGCDTTQQSRISHRSSRRNSTPPLATGKGVKASESGGAARGAAAPSSDAQDSWPGRPRFPSRLSRPTKGPAACRSCPSQPPPGQLRNWQWLEMSQGGASVPRLGKAGQERGFAVSVGVRVDGPIKRETEKECQRRRETERDREEGRGVWA